MLALVLVLVIVIVIEAVLFRIAPLNTPCELWIDYDDEHEHEHGCEHLKNTSA